MILDILFDQTWQWQRQYLVLDTILGSHSTWWDMKWCLRLARGVIGRYLTTADQPAANWSYCPSHIIHFTWSKLAHTLLGGTGVSMVWLNWLRDGFRKKVAVLLDFVQMRGGEGPFQIFCPLFTNCIYWVNLGMGREGETPAQIFWHIGVQKKWYKLSKLGGGWGSR